MPRTVVRTKPCGSLEPGWMNLAIIPAMKPMMMVQRMCHMGAVLFCCTGSGEPILGRKKLPRQPSVINLVHAHAARTALLARGRDTRNLEIAKPASEDGPACRSRPGKLCLEITYLT